MIYVDNFKHIKFTNSWGNFSYFIGEREIYEGDKICLLFPDDTYDEFIVKGRSRSTLISDMGHDYTQSTRELYIEIIYHGLKLPIQLDSKMKVYLGKGKKKAREKIR